ALPFTGDLALLCGAAVLYSRFALTDVTKIAPVLHSTPGVGLKSLTAAALLVFGAVAVRAAVWPFTAWQTATLDQPPSLVALVAGRAALMLSAGALVSALRTVDLRLMGGGWERMRATTVGLLAACAAVCFAACAAAGARGSSLAWVAFAGGLVVVAVACFRV